MFFCSVLLFKPLMVPAFTPYIEIPELTRYDYDVLNISADTIDENGLHTWQYKVEDINKLRDPKYKALFVINPSNPPSYEQSMCEQLEEIFS